MPLGGEQPRLTATMLNRAARWTVGIPRRFVRGLALVLLTSMVSFGAGGLAAAHVPMIAAGPSAGGVSPGFSPVSAVNATYSVTVTPVGLPAALQWSVAVDGGAPSSASGRSNLTETLGNGTHQLALTGGGLWIPTPANLTIEVNGTSQVVRATFSEEYVLTFTESGLPVGNHSRWHVYLGFYERNANAGQTIHYVELNDTYQVVPGATLPYIPDPQIESITVNGSPLTVNFTFTPPPVLYNVTFQALGLPAYAAWAITVDGHARGVATSSTSYQFVEANGTHVYSATGPPGYGATPPAATFVVNGSALVLTVRFAEPTSYTVTFVPQGLGALGWQVGVVGAGNFSSATGVAISCRLVNGSYSFSIPSVGGLSPFPDNGSFWVAGANNNVAIVFVGHEGPVVFTELGLAVGSWWVSINGTNHTLAPGASLALELPFGSYPYAAGVNTAGFVMSVPRGSVQVGAQSQVIPLTIFALPGQVSSSSATGSLGSELKAHLPEVAAATVGVVVLLGYLVYRRYRPPRTERRPAPAPPPEAR